MVKVVFSLLRSLVRPCVFTVVRSGRVVYSGSCRRSALASWRGALRAVGLAVFVSGGSVVRVRF